MALHNGSSGHGGGKHSNMNSNSHTAQHACCSLCDEIVVLWRLAALNPGLSPEERELLHGQFRDWHLKIVEKVSESSCRIVFIFVCLECHKQLVILGFISFIYLLLLLFPVIFIVLN